MRQENRSARSSPLSSTVDDDDDDDDERGSQTNLHIQKPVQTSFKRLFEATICFHKR